MNTLYPYCDNNKCQRERWNDNGTLRLLCEKHYKEDEPRRQAQNRRKVRKWQYNNPDKLKASQKKWRSKTRVQ